MRRIPQLLIVLALLVPTARAEDAPTERRLGVVRVRGDGVAEVTWAQLGELGGQLTDMKRLEVRRGGVRVPRSFVAGDGPKLSYSLVFEARDTAGPHSGAARYEIWDHPDAAAAASAPAERPAARRVALDRVLGPLASGRPSVYDKRDHPVWFIGLAPTGQTVDVPVGPMGAKVGTTQVIEATVYSAHHGLVVMEARWGDKRLGRAAAPDASGGAVLRFRVPADAVPDTAATLSLRNVSPAPPPPPDRDVSDNRDFVAVDAIRLTGPATWRAGDLPRPVVTVTRLGPPADPLAAAGKARHVILATPPLIKGAQRLAVHRTHTGLPSAVIPVEDVYDRYGFGDPGPSAIRRFLDALQMRPDAPLAYVLLAGDATFDRTDFTTEITIPSPMARTLYNGATAADRLYTRPATSHTGGPSIGRLPFRTAEAMKAYVERLIRYERTPPAHPTRRLMRFVTSEGGFGAFIDRIIENRFRRILNSGVPPAYDISVTFASASSAYLWPPAELGDKVVADLNAGSLFFTYVGHGFAQGFDTLRVGNQQHRILHLKDAERVDIQGTPPIMFVLACTTAMFDAARGEGIGEALMKRPGGPIAYWGATRICHPGFNALIGEDIAAFMAARDGPPRLGDILDAAREQTLDIKNRNVVRFAIRQLGGVESARIAREGALMYALLGDPALKVAFPGEGLTVTATAAPAATTVQARVQGTFPVGTTLHVTLEHPRKHRPKPPHEKLDVSDPAVYPQVRENHAAMNDLVLARAVLKADAPDSASVELVVPADIAASGLVVKVHAVLDGNIVHGAAVLK